MIDLETQALNIGIDRQSLAKLYAVFISSTKNDLMEMREAYESGDFKRVKSLVHHIKGAAEGLGIEPVLRAGEELEKTDAVSREKHVFNQFDLIEESLRDLINKLEPDL